MWKPNLKFISNGFIQFKELPHTAIALIVFGVTAAYHFHTGKDLGTNFTNAIYAMYAFLLGHGSMNLWTSRNNGNGGTDPNATAPDPNAAAAPAPATAPAPAPTPTSTAPAAPAAPANVGSSGLKG